MPQTRRSKVTVTLLIDDDLKAVDLIMQLLHAKADGITVVEFGWPKEERVEQAA
jgi:hypothetical protein